ncbi:hypothetical protein [Paenibacillus sp. 2KB_22]
MDMLAAMELSRNDSKVIDVALKYGYVSPDSFARTFQSMHVSGLHRTMS